MYTVCPKCALTLVVTAADLRVAQGFVRCGRCSNVFNALARLSEDRSATPGTAGYPPLSQPTPPPAPQEAAPKEPAPQEPAPQEPTPQEEESPDPEATQQLADTDSIPDTALEFNPEATDVTQVFVEQAPDPQWSAATGKFKALLRKVQPRGPSGAAESAGVSGAPPASVSGAPPAGVSGTPPASVSRPGSPQADPRQAGVSRAGVSQPTVPQTRTPQPTALAQSTQSVQSVRPPPFPSRRQVGAPAPASAAPPATPPPPEPQSIPTGPLAHGEQRARGSELGAALRIDQDPQFDIEVDAEFLAVTAQLKPQPLPAPAPSTMRPAATTGSSAVSSATSAEPAANAAPAATATPAATAAPAGTAALAGAAAPPATKAQRAAQQNVGSRRADSPADTEMEEAPESRDFAAASATGRPEPAHLWGAGAAALVIVLAVQIVHHYRDDLAANERLYKPLTALYSALGVSLVPRWNLEAYDVRQLGASADSGSTGQLTVRASVKNIAKQPQPLPLLRVTLQDRFGNRIAARDVPPKSYLPSAVPASSFLSAGQRIDAEMAFVDPGSNAVGFEIDACLPRPGGSIACANDATR
jgi:predicted Zn finger-like uncharacterized protein